MADCFSLPNVAELVEKFKRTKENGWHGNEYTEQIIIMSDLWEAADVIEQLLAENAKLKAERDAAVADLSSTTSACDFCTGRHCKNNTLNSGGCQWEWRGVQND